MTTLSASTSPSTDHSFFLRRLAGRDDPAVAGPRRVDEDEIGEVEPGIGVVDEVRRRGGRQILHRQAPGAERAQLQPGRARAGTAVDREGHRPAGRVGAVELVGDVGDLGLRRAVVVLEADRPGGRREREGAAFEAQRVLGGRIRGEPGLFRRRRLGFSGRRRRGPGGRVLRLPEARRQGGEKSEDHRREERASRHGDVRPVHLASPVFHAPRGEARRRRRRRWRVRVAAASRRAAVTAPSGAGRRGEPGSARRSQPRDEKSPPTNPATAMPIDISGRTANHAIAIISGPSDEGQDERHQPGAGADERAQEGDDGGERRKRRKDQREADPHRNERDRADGPGHDSRSRVLGLLEHLRGVELAGIDDIERSAGLGLIGAEAVAGLAADGADRAVGVEKIGNLEIADPRAGGIGADVDRPVDDLLGRASARRARPGPAGSTSKRAPSPSLAMRSGGSANAPSLASRGDEFAPRERHRRIGVAFGMTEGPESLRLALPFAAVGVGRHRLLAAAELVVRLAVFVLPPLVHLDLAQQFQSARLDLELRVDRAAPSRSPRP